VEIASRYCDKIFIEKEWPSAARNRNRGLIESSFDICHFLDGDIVINSEYLTNSVAKLQEGDVQAVFGYLEEKSKRGLSKILLHDYSNRKPGYINAPGAGGTFIKDALIAVNGWDERIPRGEEMEIGDRLINAGYKIWYLDCKMGIHDFGMTNLFKYFKKQVREGYSIGAVTKIQSTNLFFKNIRKLAYRNIVFHILLLLVFVLSLSVWNFWIIPGTLFFYLFYLFIRIRIVRKIHNPNTILYSFLQNLTKTFEFYGYIKFHLHYKKLSNEQKQKFNKRIDIRFAILNNKGINTGN
jgi:hypothetical protein